MSIVTKKSQQRRSFRIGMSKLDPLLMATVVLLSVSRFSSNTSSRIGETRICCPRRRRSQSVSTAGRNGWRESSTSSVLPRLAVFSALNNRYVRGLLQASIFSAKKGMYVYAECRPILRYFLGLDRASKATEVFGPRDARFFAKVLRSMAV